MSFEFQDMDKTIRQKMLDEVQYDIDKEALYLSKRFTNIGNEDYPNLLKDAIKSHNEVWLTQELNRNARIAEYEMTVKGQKKVPHTAAQTTAEGEFNRFYIRAVCLTAIEQKTNVEVYRAQEVANARSASLDAIGKIVDPKAVLADLRANIGIDTHLGLPAGPNSGLSVKLP